MTQLEIQYPKAVEKIVDRILLQYGELHNPLTLKSGDDSDFITLEWVGSMIPSEEDMPYLLSYQSIIQNISLVLEGYVAGKEENRWQ